MSYSIETMEDCASLYGIFEVASFSDPRKTYRVELHGETYAHCTCLAFTHFKGVPTERTCKHIDLVFQEACLCNPQWREAKSEPKLRPVGYTYDAFTGGTCICGEKLVAVRRKAVPVEEWKAVSADGSAARCLHAEYVKGGHAQMESEENRPAGRDPQVSRWHPDPHQGNVGWREAFHEWDRGTQPAGISGLGGGYCRGGPDPQKPEAPKYFEPLTDDERQLIQDLGRCYTRLATLVIPDGPNRHVPNRDDDLREARSHIHALQHMIMAQAAGRCYPEEFRLLGEAGRYASHSG